MVTDEKLAEKTMPNKAAEKISTSAKALVTESQSQDSVLTVEKAAEKDEETPVAKEPVSTGKEKLAEKAAEKTADIKPTAKPTVAKKEAKPEVKDEVKKKSEIVLKRNYTIPLAKAYAKPAKKRAAKAIKLVRAFAARHFKSPEEKVKIDERVANYINSRGSKKPPKSLKVTLLKDKEGTVKVVPA
ncbi:MAG: 50S ribosomal protein L31e [Candidatus Micrarchaeota archaeon]